MSATARYLGLVIIPIFICVCSFCFADYTNTVVGMKSSMLAHTSWLFSLVAAHTYSNASLTSAASQTSIAGSQPVSTAAVSPAGGATTTAALVQNGTATGSPGATYTNPILDAGADPWVIRYEGYYYMTYTTNDNITLLRSSVLTDWRNADSRALFVPPPGMNYSTDLWAPELHQIDGAWYVIFTADPRGDQPPPETDMYCTYTCPAVNHRMYVLAGTGSDPFTATFTGPTLLNTYDQFAIDGTYFQHTSGLFHIYSCWYRQYDGWPSNLCISKMSDPSMISSNFTERQIISVPSNPWEKTPYGRMENYRLSSNEGPQQLTNPQTGQQFVIYSAARSDNRNYCLGQLELVGDDPMNPSDWKKNNDGCVFYQNPAGETFGVGHASFTVSPDGSENWIVYHGMRDPTNGWSARSIRTQKFTWNVDGSPKFPRPGYGPYVVPSGQ